MISGKTAGCSSDGCLSNDGCDNSVCPYCAWTFTCTPSKETDANVKKLATLEKMEMLVKKDKDLSPIVENMKNTLGKITLKCQNAMFLFLD